MRIESSSVLLHVAERAVEIFDEEFQVRPGRSVPLLVKRSRMIL